MKDIVLIDSAVPQWKGNLHMHTTLSDGKADPSTAVEEYRQKGYHFCLISDHNVYWDSPELDRENFCVLSGTEVAFDRHPQRPYLIDHRTTTSMHLNLIKTGRSPYQHKEILPRPMDFGLDSWNQAVLDYQKENHLVMLNHPNWSRLAPEWMLAFHGCFAVEIFNTASWQGGCLSDEAIWDYCLVRGKRIWATANDDTHVYGEQGACCGQAFNMVTAPELTASSLTNALKAGRFYPSTGPVIHDMRIENGELRIRFSPVRSVRVTGGTAFGTGRTAKAGETLETFAWKIKEQLQYFRVTLTDERGFSAWTQPVFLEDLLEEPRMTYIWTSSKGEMRATKQPEP